ncbi:hypothetical protein BX600DRAFT_41283 [Xylariales sp. PMI_506]|nr:hypothetical protein BX600DRAFT_41283 [Xylariales sp. PMI_506]
MRVKLFYLCCSLAISINAHLLSSLPSHVADPLNQKPLLEMDPVGHGGVSAPSVKLPNADKPSQGDVILSDVMGKDRSINIFAGLTRDIQSISQRLDDSTENSTVLAPLNSAIDQLPRKPWEDAQNYNILGASAYEGGDGQERALRNLRRFVEAHMIPKSPWPEGEKVRTLLGDREVWWESKEGKTLIQPDNIELESIASRVANGEVWIIRGVRNYR